MGKSHTAVSTGKTCLAMQANEMVVASVPGRGMPMGVGTVRLTRGAPLFLTEGVNSGDTMGIEGPVGMRQSHLCVANILRKATAKLGRWMTIPVGAAVFFVGGLGPQNALAKCDFLTRWKGMTLMRFAGAGRLRRAGLPGRRSERACLARMHT